MAMETYFKDSEGPNAEVSNPVVESLHDPWLQRRYTKSARTTGLAVIQDLASDPGGTQALILSATRQACASIAWRGPQGQGWNHRG